MTREFFGGYHPSGFTKGPFYGNASAAGVAEEESIPAKNITLGLCGLLAASAQAHSTEYRVREGDTFSSIAAKFHVNVSAILTANDLHRNHHLRVGHFLSIPGVSHYSDFARKQEVPAGKRLYTVRNGDFDWAIAKRHGITVHQLHSMNPGVNWDALRVGLKIRVPGSGTVGHQTVVASRSGLGPSHLHTVKEGENDWIIAHRAGVRLGALKAVNPGVDLTDLHPGQKIRVPGSGQSERVAVRRIRSTHVAINGDNVTIRRGPGTDEDSICTVDVGTRAAVLDRDGDWYQLRFPKGTVGWVRGDLLRAAHESAVARSEHRRHRRAEYVATYRHGRRRHGHGIPESYSSTEYTALQSSAGDASELLEKANSMRGTRYAWGEASRSGTDCSGFTSQVFRTQGIHLPRTSREQATVGQHVKYGDLKAGDLVFFHTARGHRVTHVGIYIGHGKFIHASSGGGRVQVNSLGDGYYAHRLVTARRVKGLHKAQKASAPDEVVPSDSTHEPDSK